MSAPSPGSELPRTDQLAIERTLLANERTFLAYFRTAMVFLTSGLAIRDIDFFHNIRYLSVLLIGLSPTIFVLGVWRAAVVRKRILAHRQEG